VVQCLLPKKRVELDKSAYRIVRGKTERVPIYVYNFGTEPAEVRLSVKGPESWDASLAESIGIAPGAREMLPLSISVPPAAEEIETILIEADRGSAGEAVLSMRFLPK